MRKINELSKLIAFAVTHISLYCMMHKIIFFKSLNEKPFLCINTDIMLCIPSHEFYFLIIAILLVVKYAMYPTYFKSLSVDDFLPNTFS